MSNFILVLTARELKARTFNDVPRMLRPISRYEGGPASLPKSTSQNWIITVFDGAPRAGTHQDSRFTTIARDLLGNYFEVWLRIDEDRWCLQQAYLNLFQVDRSSHTESKFISLHCDPNEPDDNDHAIYKKGPHLHVYRADYPISKAHIALNKGHLDEVLVSAQSLSDAFEEALNMLREEIILHM